MKNARIDTFVVWLKRRVTRGRQSIGMFSAAELYETLHLSTSLTNSLMLHPSNALLHSLRLPDL